MSNRTWTGLEVPAFCERTEPNRTRTRAERSPSSCHVYCRKIMHLKCNDVIWINTFNTCVYLKTFKICASISLFLLCLRPVGGGIIKITVICSTFKRVLCHWNWCSQCCDLETMVSRLEFILSRSRSWSRDLIKVLTTTLYHTPRYLGLKCLKTRYV